ncbi:MAG: SDR family oxidoreductase [Planctomycetes bacterium]|nr:SDR family oxidoreductase [Planctomycetota bacterium]
MELTGRKALVTGAALRVGREIALELARAGATIYLHYRSSEEPARRTAEEIRALGAGAVLVRGDLADPREVERVAEECRDADVLVNSASVFPRTPLRDATVEGFDGIMAVNVRAPFFLARTMGLAMRARGSGVIVNIADWSGYRPHANYLPYCMSKAALLAMNSGLARILAPEVRVNAVAPGPVMLPADMDEDLRRRVIASTPLGREGSPTDVARAVRFLVDGSDYITGAVLAVDGGRLIA